MNPKYPSRSVRKVSSPRISRLSATGACCVALSIGLFAVPLKAASITWTATGAGNWSDSTKWAASGIPGSGSSDTTIYFFTSATGPSSSSTSTNDIGVVTLNQLILSGSLSTARTETITGGTLQFEGTGAGIANNSAGSVVNYVISSAIALPTDGSAFSLSGDGTGYVKLSGGLTWSQDQVIETSGTAAYYITGTLAGGDGTKTLTLQGTGTNLYFGNSTSVVSGTFGTLTINGPTVNFNAANTFSSNVTINSGTAIASVAGSAGVSGPLGTGTVTINTGGEVKATYANSLIGNASIVLNGGTIRNAATGSITIGGSISVTADSTIIADRTSAGAGGYTYTMGTLKLANSNLTVTNSANITSGTMTVSLGATTISGSSGFNVVPVTSAGATGMVATITGLSDDGTGNSSSLTKTGAGMLTISGSNTYTGNIYLEEGTLRLTTATATDAGTIYIGGGSADATLDASPWLAGVNVYSPIVVLQGSGAKTLGSSYSSGNASYYGSITLLDNLYLSTAGTGMSFYGAISGTGNLNFNGAGNIAVIALINTSGTISNVGSKGRVYLYSIGSKVASVVQNSSASYIALSGTTASAYKGAYVVQSGTLQISSAKGASAANEVKMNAGGVLDIAASGTIGGLSGVDGVVQNVTSNTYVLTIGGSENYTYGGSISSTTTNRLSLIKNGTGTQTLSGTSNYTGKTAVNNGTLKIDANTGLLGLTALSMGGGTFAYDASNVTSESTRTQSLGALQFVNGSSTVETTLGGTATGVGLTFASLTTRTAGATGNFVVSDGVNGGTNKITITDQAAGFIDQGTFFNGSNYAYYDSTGYVRGIYWDGVEGFTTSGATTIATTAYAQATGAITSQATATFTVLNLVNTANASQAFTLASGATVTTNGILLSGNGGAGAVTTISGGTAIKAASGKELVIRTDKVNDSLVINTPITANGTNILVKDGDGTLTMGTANTYTGATYVNGGVLSIHANSGLGAEATGASLYLNNGTLQATETFGLYNGTEGTKNRNVILTNTGTFEVADSKTLTVSGVISGTAGGLAKSGAGTLQLNGVNTYVGTTAINAGTVKLGASGSIASSSAIKVATSGTFDVSAQNSTPFTVGTAQSLTNNGTITGNVAVSGQFNGTGKVSGNLSILSTGVLDPGESYGIQTVTGDLSALGTISLQIAMHSTAGTGYDQLIVQGGVTLGGTLDLTLGTDIVSGDFYTLILNNGSSAISGNFSSIVVDGVAVTLDSNNHFTYNDQEYAISYTAGSSSLTGGNDLALMAVPEPSTWAMVFGGLGMLIGMRRFIRRREAKDI